ncbi:MAG TPA: TIGR02265 family protein [Gemmatimonadaceae bacterium]|nr:TIGR02265 family protein [Gemmatimonadaceae bacterium]
MQLATKQQVKGGVLKSRLQFVEDTAGKDAVQRVLAALPDEDRKSLAMLLTAQWYPFEVGKRLDAAIVAEVGGGRADYFERLGEASAEKNLATVHRNFLTQGDAHGFLAKAPTIYKLYYGAGRREYERTGDRSGRLTTYDAETFSAPDCLTIVGWHRRALQLCGIDNVRVVETECRARGGAVCRYEVSWS